MFRLRQSSLDAWLPVLDIEWTQLEIKLHPSASSAGEFLERSASELPTYARVR